MFDADKEAEIICEELDAEGLNRAGDVIFDSLIKVFLRIRRETWEEAAEMARSGLVQVNIAAPYTNYLEAWEAIREAISDALRSKAAEITEGE